MTIALIAALLAATSASAPAQDFSPPEEVMAVDAAADKAKCYPNRDPEGSYYPVCVRRRTLYELKVLDIETDAYERKLRLSKREGVIDDKAFAKGLEDVSERRREFREGMKNRER